MLVVIVRELRWKFVTILRKSIGGPRATLSDQLQDRTEGTCEWACPIRVRSPPSR
jgi:hypothetical protein